MKIRPQLKRILAAAYVLLLPLAVQGRIVRFHSYQERTDKADLVVIAKPLETRKTGAKRVFDGIHVFEALTEFELRVVFKGDNQLRKIVLRHFILPSGQTLISPPMLPAFDEKNPKSFVLFLKKDADGKYTPVFGQEDPMGIAIVELLANDGK